MSDRARRDIGRYTLLPEWVLRRGLSARGLQLYCELGLMADYDTGTCDPTHATLGIAMECSTDTVARAQAECVDAEVIDVDAQWTDAGDRRSNLYTVLTVDPRCPVRPTRKSAGGSPQNGARGTRKSAGASTSLLNEKDAAVESTARAADRLRAEQQAHAQALDATTERATRNHAAEALARLREGRPILDATPVE
jgi:hypothetical protein